MAEKKIDLNKLRSEIDSRKKGQHVVSSQLGETVMSGVAPRDEFLNGLLKARETGQSTPSINLIKTVENTVATKHGEAPKYKINENTPQVNQRNKIDMSPERDEQLFADLENKRKQTLAESIEKYTNSSNSNSTNLPPMVNYNGQQMLTSLPQTASAPQQINEAVLVESVKEIVNTHLVENFGPILEEAIKNTVIEMYAVERIKAVLDENTDLIEKVVYNTIRKIQAKTKAKQTA